MTGSDAICISSITVSQRPSDCRKYMVNPEQQAYITKWVGIKDVDISSGEMLFDNYKAATEKKTNPKYIGVQDIDNIEGKAVIFAALKAEGRAKESIESTLVDTLPNTPGWEALLQSRENSVKQNPFMKA